jgi:hypothetical protein
MTKYLKLIIVSVLLTLNSFADESLSSKSVLELKKMYRSKKHAALQGELLEEMLNRDLSKESTESIDSFAVPNKTSNSNVKKLSGKVRAKVLRELLDRKDEMGVYARLLKLNYKVTKKNINDRFKTLKTEFDDFELESTSRNKFVRRKLNSVLEDFLKRYESLPAKDIPSDAFATVDHFLENANSKDLDKDVVKRLSALRDKNTAFSFSKITKKLKSLAGFGSSPTSEMCEKKVDESSKRLTKSDRKEVFAEQSKTTCSLVDGSEKKKSVREFSFTKKGDTYDCKGNFICKVPNDGQIRVAGGFKWILLDIISCSKRGPWIR